MKKSLLIISFTLLVQSHASLNWPVKNFDTWDSTYNGFKAYYSVMGGYHPGVDISLPGRNDVGQNVYPIAEGTIYRIIPFKSTIGGAVVMKHNINGKIYYSVYYHIKPKSYLTVDEIPVKTSTVIGTVGNISRFGPHLHLEVRTKMQKDLYPNDMGNGYYKTTALIDRDGLINPIAFIKNTSLTSSQTSIIDGAGSLVSPNEYCWGCDRDQANMQSHSGENSTVVFQWRYDKDSCSQIDISADRDIGDVIIRAKGWKDKVTKVATSVKLSSSPISIRRPNRKSNWTTLAVTTQKPLTKEAEIYAYCKKKGSNYLNGNRGSASKDFVNFNLDYVWSGTGSLISQSKKSNYDGFGHNRDWAITYFKKKSLTTFQWDSTTCHEITITNGKTDDYYANNVKVDIKGWDFKDWKSACYELPCTIKKTNDYYYILKIKSPVKAITKGYIQVKCENQ